MEKQQNLIGQEAIEKIRGFLDNNKLAMMATKLDSRPFSVCPMTTQEIDEDGKLWFFTGKNSEHYRQLEKDNRLHLTYANQGDQEYLSVYGVAHILEDKQKIDELWSSILKVWFSGKDDPNLALLCVTIKDAYYWDQKYNKAVTIFKMAKAAIIGEQDDTNDQGELKV
ncbi:pyridoxamine 5'-phosphate oxidase family protein [Psychroserpens sp. Hel_I_66]|uniref:pyridoxamine 5'-phosphate oxidase family protein n=1 Tax=Psychroserpens sp. Hel_I_66 TaxID=1250004 RepID=UPI0006460EA9|nr:pyridoxamine 5'-phosphate oxidase family protein [Psychroserpens sp. Hel_I_66]